MTHKHRLGTAGYYVVSIVLAVIALIPFMWMISTSLKSRGALMSIPIEWIPAEPTLDGYAKVFSRFPFLRTIGNSLLISVAYTIITLISASMAAFAFAKLRFRGSGAILSVYIATMMIPTQVTMIPLFVVMNRLGLIDSYASVILPSMFKPFAVFLLVQQMKTIPNDYIDAARIDGAGLFQTYRKVALPLCIPTLATLAVTTFMESWNDYLWPMIMLGNETGKYTIPVMLNAFTTDYYKTELYYGAPLAGSVIVSIPILVLFAFTSRQFISGMTSGAFKM